MKHCTGCGQAMTDEQSFCLQCGVAAGPLPPASAGSEEARVPRVAPASSEEAPAPRVVSAGGGLRANLLAALFGVLALLMIGGILMLVESRKAPEPPQRVAVSTPTPTSKPPATPEPEPEKTSTPEPSPSETSERFQIPLEEFSGMWLPESGPSLDVIHLDLSRDELVAPLPSESATLILRAGRGEEELAGTLSSPSEGEAMVTANVSKDMFELTLTVTPDGGEPYKRVLHRPYYTVGSPLDQSMAQAYLPGFDLVQVFEARYPDGEAASVTSTTGILRTGILRTQVENASGSDEVYHFVAREDGIYRVTDSRPDEEELWLPNSLDVGTRWKTDTWQSEVMEMNAVVDLGFDKFQCLKVQRTNPAVEVSETAYFAPGHGLVRVEDAEGKPTLRMTHITNLAPGAAEGDVRKKAVNLDRITPGQDMLK